MQRYDRLYVWTNLMIQPATPCLRPPPPPPPPVVPYLLLKLGHMQHSGGAEAQAAAHGPRDGCVVRSERAAWGSFAWVEGERKYIFFTLNAEGGISPLTCKSPRRVPHAPSPPHLAPWECFPLCCRSVAAWETASLVARIRHRT